LNDLKKKIEEDFSEFKTMIEVEKKERVDNENNLYKLIKEMHQKMLSDIKEEKKEREKTETTLV